MARKSTPAERRQALGSFVITDDDPDWERLDRSQLEPWASCPLKAAMLERKKVTLPSILYSGIEAHEAIAKMIREWLDCNGLLSVADIMQILEGHIWASRPDVQPDVKTALRPSLYSIARFFKENIHPGEILGFDGGEEMDPPRGGQLAADLPDLRKTITAELDLIYTSPSKEVLCVIDWKSGNAIYGVQEIASSFQFQYGSVLIWENYPDVQRVEWKVWNTRKNLPSQAVAFHRSLDAQFRTRIRHAIEVRERYRHLETPPAWPSWENCSGCEAAVLCSETGGDVKTVASNPQAALRTLICLQERAAAYKKALTAYTDRHGDLFDGSVAFGRNKPPERRAEAKVYEVDLKE